MALLRHIFAVVALLCTLTLANDVVTVITEVPDAPVTPPEDTTVMEKSFF